MQLLAQLGGLLGGSRGSRMGKYRIVRRLAEGGMGEIFIGRAKGRGGFEKIVVLKRILQQNVGDRYAVRMFLDEARLMAALNHPNIVQVYDFGTARGGQFFAMEYVPGEDVGRIMKAATLANRTLPLELAIGVIAEAAAGLHYAHEMRGEDGSDLQIVHRDISPSNVLVSYDGAVKLTDFGIAKWNKRQTETRYGALKGKIQYMSPEQCLSEPLDRRSDVFGLGILLFELTTGTRLFQGTSDFGVLEQIVHHDVPRPSTRRAGYPPAIERIVMRALARSPDERYQTARDLQLELEAYALENRLPISAVARAAEMHALFGKKVEAWRQALREGRPLEQLAAPAEAPEREGRTITRPEAAGLSAFDATEHIRHAAPPRSRLPLIVALGAVAVGAGTSVLLLRHRGGAAPKAAVVAPVATPAVVAPSVAPPTPAVATERTTTTTTTSTSTNRSGGRGRRRAAGPSATGPVKESSGDKKKIWNPDSIYLP